MRNRNIVFGMVAVATLTSVATACSHDAATDEEEIAMSAPKSQPTQADGYDAAGGNATDFSTLSNQIETIGKTFEAGGTAPNWTEGAVIGVELLHSEVSDRSRNGILAVVNAEALKNEAFADFVVSEFSLDAISGKDIAASDIMPIFEKVSASGGEDAKRRAELSEAIARFIAANPGVSVSAFYGEGTRRRVAGMVLSHGSGPALLIQRRLTAAISHVR